MYYDHSADLIVAESNNGGMMVQEVIWGIDDSVPVKLVTASRGKAIRAEPVANLYQQGRIHHVGMFEKLEEQMVEWDATDPDPSWSPDRMDALVWCFSELLIGTKSVYQTKLKDQRLKNRR